MKDTLFKSDDVKGEFRFDARVAEVFDDMLSRSVPFYGEVQRIIAGLATAHYRNASKIFDLGCSTGTTIINICNAAAGARLDIIGVDSSEPVIARAREKISKANPAADIELLCNDIRDIEIKDASVVIMNYTLQFIKPESRKALIRRIYKGLNKGGILLLSEKVLEGNAAMSDLFIDKYYDFKREMGYSDLEIAKKREALDKVLIPMTTDKELKLLKEGGFDNVSTFFKWFNFASFIAVKG
ncbi:MAG: carboxy-S-adenosyl-L-methionine synthase CmoA [bacterium]|nr:carboxy-S-adenosyl-L-methionine synthase CmoA [bacterium]